MARRFVGEARRRGIGPFLRSTVGEVGALLAQGLGMRVGGAAGSLVRRLEFLRREVGQAARGLRRDPGFTLVVAGTLALGVGTGLSVFQVVDRVLLAAPEYQEPDRLLLAWHSREGSEDRFPIPGPDAAALEARTSLLEGVAFLMRGVDGALQSREGTGVEHVRISAVTPDFFDLLGVRPALGRDLSPEEAAAAPEAGSGVPALVTHGLWSRVLGGDPGILERDVVVNGQAVRVVGVLPADFRLRVPPDVGVDPGVEVFLPLLVPLSDLHRDERLLDRDSDNTGVVVARMAPGATLPQVRAEADRVAATLREEIPAYGEAGVGLILNPLHADATRHARGPLLALLAGALLVLLVGCLNIAGLLLARGSARGRELAVRAALGAGSRGVVGHLLAESLVLVLLGGVGAVGVALLLEQGVARALPSVLQVAGSGGSGWGATGIFGGSLLVGALLLFGAGPAWVLRQRDLRGLLARGSVGTAGAGVRRGVVVTQVALSLVLVLGAGLLFRGVARLVAVDPGFRAQGALSFRVSLRVPDRYRSPGDRAALMRELAERVERLPGVTSVGYSGALPLGGERWTQPWGLPGEPPQAWEGRQAHFRVASSGYFEAVGTRLLEGRGFLPREDLVEEERVVVVDEHLARQVAPPGGSALDAVIGLPVDGAPVEARIVGVVEAVRMEELHDGRGEAVYVPYRQEASREVAFVVRTAGDPLGMADPVRAAVREVDPQIPVYDLRPLSAYLAEQMAAHRVVLGLLGLFGALALLGTALGLYGVVAFDAGRRTRELGVRAALGASPGRVVRGVLARGLGVALVGAGMGTLLAAWTAPVLSRALPGIVTADPVAWAAAVGIVVGITLLASWVPAWRAGRASPARALRTE